MVAGVSQAWISAVSDYRVHMQSLGVLASTVDLRGYQLLRVAQMMGSKDPWAVTMPDLVAWFTSLIWAANTRRSYRTTVQGFYRWGVEAGHVDQSPAAALPRVRPAPPNPRPVPDRVYLLALAVAEPRERIMLRLAAEHGLRRGEIALVHSRDLLEDHPAGWSLLVHGKGGKERLVPLLGGLAAELRSLPAGWAFPGRDGGHLSPRWVGKLVSRLLEGDWTTHKLRHRAATAWWEASGHDVLTVAELLGHADPKTTALYVKVRAERLRAVVEGVEGVA